MDRVLSGIDKSSKPPTIHLQQLVPQFAPWLAVRLCEQADRFTDESEIRRGRQLPFQYFAAYLNATAQPYSSNYDFRPKMRSIESDVCQINASG